MYCTFAALYGYDAYHAGLVLSPGGLVTMMFMPVAGFLLGRRVDARWLIVLGLVSVAGAT